MKLKRKIIAITLISLFLLSTIPLVSADDVDYELDNAKVNLIVQDNGLLHVTEAIKYHFDSSANGVYRDIQLKDNQTIENLRVGIDGAYGTYEIFNESNKFKIKVYLYSDSAKTHKIHSGSDITVYYDYDMTHAIKIYKDTAELHYKLWGEEWDVSLYQLKGTVEFQDKTGIEYWINPYNKVTNENFKNNILNVESGYIPDGQYLEVRALIPLEQFDNPIYAQFINSNGKEEVRKIQEDYDNANNFAEFGFKALIALGFLSLIIPLRIYWKYGREPKISYNGIYEREPPTKDSPVLVNALQGGLSSTVGSIDNHGFQAAVMDLINRNYLKISREEISEDGLLADKDSAILNINYEKINELSPNEKLIINMLKEFEENGSISLKDMKSKLHNTVTAEKFVKDLDYWKRDFIDTYLPKDEFKKYFIDDGAIYLIIYGIVLAIFGGIMLYLSLGSIVESSFMGGLVGILFLILGIGTCFLPNTIGGRWTEYGAEFNAKWKNFKKYLKEYSLINEHPPESIAIWNEYLVYGTALGVADNVYKAMKTNVPTGAYYDNDLFLFYSIGGYHSLNSAITTGISTSSSNDSAGGVGGGSGGGGGGAF